LFRSFQGHNSWRTAVDSTTSNTAVSGVLPDRSRRFSASFPRSTSKTTAARPSTTRGAPHSAGGPQGRRRDRLPAPMSTRWPTRPFPPAGREVRAALGRLTAGLSPVQLVSAYFDWLSHLAISPGRRERLRKSLQHKLMELGALATAQAALDDEALAQALEGTPFAAEAWQKAPFNLFAK